MQFMVRGLSGDSGHSRPPLPYPPQVHPHPLLNTGHTDLFEIKHTRGIPLRKRETDSKHSTDTFRSQWKLHARANVFVSAFASMECVKGRLCMPS